VNTTTFQTANSQIVDFQSKNLREGWESETIGTKVELLSFAYRAILNFSSHSEGPVYIPQDNSIVREQSCFQNGNALDLEGRIVVCSHGQRAIIYPQRLPAEISHLEAG